MGKLFLITVAVLVSGVLNEAVTDDTGPYLTGGPLPSIETPPPTAPPTTEPIFQPRAVETTVPPAPKCCAYPSKSPSGMTNVTAGDFQCQEPITMTCLASNFKDTDFVGIVGFFPNSKDYMIIVSSRDTVTATFICNTETTHWGRSFFDRMEYEYFACMYYLKNGTSHIDVS